MLKKLGVKPNKALPTPMVEQANEGNDSADME